MHMKFLYLELFYFCSQTVSYIDLLCHESILDFFLHNSCIEKKNIFTYFRIIGFLKWDFVI